MGGQGIPTSLLKVLQQLRQDAADSTLEHTQPPQNDNAVDSRRQEPYANGNHIDCMQVSILLALLVTVSPFLRMSTMYL